MNKLYITKLEQVLQENFKWHKSRIKFLSLFIISLIKSLTVNLSRIAILFQNDSKIKSNYKRLQRFFRFYKINYDFIANFIVSVTPKRDQYIITLDRTNWKFGKMDINILMLAIVYNDISIPLYWDLLPKQGNSSTEERIAIVEKAIALLGKENIRSIVADREFIGIRWFRYLQQAGITFHIRIKSGTCIDSHKTKGKRVDKLFRMLKPNRYIEIPKPVILYKQTVYISGMKIKNDYLILASNRKPMEALEDYKKRWTIEKLFGHMKTKGFNFESTHLTNAERIKKLIALVTIAFVWSYLIGIWMDAKIKIKFKNHGRLSISYFRNGLDYLTHVIENIRFKHKYQEFISFTNLLSCT